MKLSELNSVLESSAAETPVVYFTETAAIGAGYHVTELKSAKVSSIDCGGNINHFHEVTLQLLDGDVGRHMSAQKLSRILQHSLKALAELDQADLKVEFAPKNAGLQIFKLGQPIVTEFDIRLPLLSDSAVCKPAAAQGSSCGPDTCKTQESCC